MVHGTTSQVRTRKCRSVCTMENHARIAHIDIARGIAIFLVVAGHLLHGVARDVIFLFHMPFFFVLSGFLHRLQADEKAFLRRKASSLLIPYFVYLMLFGALELSGQVRVFVMDPSVSGVGRLLYGVARLLYGGELLNGLMITFWFVTCFFLTQQFYNFVAIRVRRRWVLWLLAAILYAIAVVSQHTVSGRIPFPWDVNVVCCSFLFYFVGSRLGGIIFSSKCDGVALLALVASVIGGALVWRGVPLPFDMKWGDYGIFVLSPLLALCLVRMLSLCSHLMARINILGTPLGYAGKASLTIMFVHQYFRALTFDASTARPWTMSIIILLASLSVHWAVERHPLSRAIFLGSPKDVHSLIRYLRKRQLS